MTNPSPPSADIQKLLKELEAIVEAKRSTKATYKNHLASYNAHNTYNNAAQMHFEILLSYIRTLEKEHREMREEFVTLSVMGRFGDEGTLLDAVQERAQRILSSLTICA